MVVLFFAGHRILSCQVPWEDLEVAQALVYQHGDIGTWKVDHLADVRAVEGKETWLGLTDGP